jgi:hypothetical protein
MKRVLLLVFMSLWLLTLQNVHAAGMALEGRVYEAAGQKGIPALTLKLIPPRDLRGVEKITTTDDRGSFHFSALDRGRYLLEIYQGVMLLYREVINVDRDTRKDIELRRKQ